MGILVTFVTALLVAALLASRSTAQLGSTGSTSSPSRSTASTTTDHGRERHGVHRRHRDPRSHQDFGGRASGGYDFVDNDTTPSDGNGHAPTSPASRWCQYGVAKGIRIVPVRVLGDNGAGTFANILAGLAWFGTTRTSRPSPCSASAVPGRRIDQAVKALIDSGVAVAVAAGASGGTSDGFSPARVPDALTVAASDAQDRAAPSNNHGPGIDLYAPGVAVTAVEHERHRHRHGSWRCLAFRRRAAALYLARVPTATPPRCPISGK